MKIGIIGQGVLGKTHKNYLLKNTSNEVFTYDINGDCNSTMEIMSEQCEIIFVCVPTDTGKDKRLDMSIVEKISKQLNDLGFKGKCIFRSTLRVGTTEKLQKKYPDIIFYFIPEFLTERFAKEDFEKPHRNLPIGSSNIDDGIELYKIISENNILKGVSDIIGTKEAEMLKIATNSFYSMKIIFANELNFVCNGLGLDYDFIKDELVKDFRIGSNDNDSSGKDVHFRVSQDGKKGYGGKCLPKDSLEFSEMSNSLGIKNGLINKVVQINNKIREF